LILAVGAGSTLVATLAGATALSRQASESAGLAIGEPSERPDRLIEIRGSRSLRLIAEFSSDEGRTWAAATIVPGPEREVLEDERTEGVNDSAGGGAIPAGDRVCLWSHPFDYGLPSGRVALRLRDPGGSVLLQKEFDAALLAAGGLRVDDQTVVRLAGGSWKSPWTLAPTAGNAGADASIRCVSDVPEAPVLDLDLQLQGWHRIFAGIDGGTTLRYSFSGHETIRDVPVERLRPLRGAAGERRQVEEWELPCEDLTGRRLRLMMGGGQRTSIHHIRFVPMTSQETASHLASRQRAREHGRPFAGYLEPVTVCFYSRSSLGLRDHLRNEMRLNAERGSTDVYVHVIRIGTRAWYHSDVVQRQAFRNADEMRQAAAEVARQFDIALPRAETLETLIAGNLNWTSWMEEGDPLAVAVAEGRALGLKVFADAGMNVTHIKDRPFMTEATVRNHPEFLSSHKMFMDFRIAGVRDYVVSVCRELLLKYDLDGLHLDFARWGYKDAYDVPSLNDVVRRIHEARAEAEQKWGHRVLLAARIPSYVYDADAAWSEAYYGGEHPWFLEALREWARRSWIDRVMACSMSKKRIVELSLGRYRDALAGSKVALWGDLYAFHGRSPAALAELGRKWIAEGLNGGFFIYDRKRPTVYEDLQWQLRLLGIEQ
jgi:hypothetical protein